MFPATQPRSRIVRLGPLLLARLVLLGGYVLAVYAVVLGGGGALFGHGGEVHPVLLLVSAIVTAVGFARARRYADRLLDLVVHREAMPYDTLRRLTVDLSSAGSLEDVLPRLAHLLCAGTGARTCTVWLTVDQRLMPAASWPAQPEAAAPVATLADLATLADVDHTVAVLDAGVELGALTIGCGGRDFVTPVAAQLMADVANSAGLLLRSVRLTAQLRERLRQAAAQARALHGSRLRLLTARDAARQRLGQEIETTLCVNLRAIRTRLPDLERTLRDDVPAARARLSGIERDIERIIQEFRTVVQGVYPPVLADHGLVPALRSLGGHLPGPMEVSGRGVGRYPQVVEATIYFCTATLVRRWAGGATPRPLAVHVVDSAGTLSVTVTTDATDPGTADESEQALEEITDRMAAAGGTLHLAAGASGTADDTGRRLLAQLVLPIEREVPR